MATNNAYRDYRFGCSGILFAGSDMGDSDMKIDDLGYVEEMRQRLGHDAEDTSCDNLILNMTPIARVRLIAGWYLGGPDWAEEFKSYFESQGLYLTTNPEADGVIRD